MPGRAPDADELVVVMSAIALALASIDFCINVMDLVSASMEALRSSPMLPKQNATEDEEADERAAAAAADGGSAAGRGEVDRDDEDRRDSDTRLSRTSGPRIAGPRLRSS